MNATELAKILEYDSNSGIFTWKITIGTAIKGAVAGCVNHHGYREITVSGVKYQAHRLAWLASFHYWPECVIDHKNRRRDDNRIDNLRDVSIGVNNLNKVVRSDNKTGFTGINWDASRTAWRATAQKSGKQTHIGYFKDLQTAKKARLDHLSAEAE